MAKEMVSVRIDSALRDALVREAGEEGRSMANMLERLLSERYQGGLAERAAGVPQPERPVESPSPAGAVRSASPSEPVATVPGMGAVVRPHMKRHRPAVECPTRWPSGVCPDCGQTI